MSHHVPVPTLRRFVEGEVPADEVEVLSRHVAACEPCAAALTQAARFEAALHEVACATADASPLPSGEGRGEGSNPRGARRALWRYAAAACALAACVVFALSLRLQAPALPDCRSEADQQACVARADADGLAVIGPDSEVHVPRYDRE